MVSFRRLESGDNFAPQPERVLQRQSLPQRYPVLTKMTRDHGELTISYSSGNVAYSETITHNYGTPPAYLAYLKGDDQGNTVYIQLPEVVISAANQCEYIIKAFSTPTAFYARATVPTASSIFGSPQTFLIKYYLLDDPAKQM